MKKIKLIFSSSTESESNNYFLSPIFWMLRMYHENFGLSKHEWAWTTPYAIINVSDQQQQDLIDLIINDNIDLVAFSMYSWNRQTVLTVSRQLKQLNPNLTIVIGGPDVDAHRDPTFFPNHSYIDYAVYGDGEAAFTRLLDHLMGHSVNLINVVDSTLVHPHEVFKEKSALSVSPFIQYRDDFINYFEFLFNYFKQNNIKRNIVPVWETTKGCPYACSFCDWSSGLHNKVRFWGKDELIPNWQKEIDLFFEIQERFSLEQFVIEWTNPNIGLSRQDEEIVEYWCNLKKRLGRGPIIRAPQLSKLNKETTFRLLDKMIDARVTYGFKFDVQDVDQEVLKNVDRPEIPWEEHKKFILALKSKWKKQEDYFIVNGNKYKNRINFIWGLPGQTLNHLKNNIIEAGSVRSYAFILPFDLLPNSPAFNKDYQERFKIKYKKISFVNTDFFIERAVVSTYSLTEYDYYYGYILGNFYSAFYSKLRAPIIGQEYKIFDNAYKIQNLIDMSYPYFERDGIIGLMDDDVLTSVPDYLIRYQDKLLEMFDLK